MADPIWELDPTSEDAANTPLVLSNTTNYGITAFSLDAAGQSVQWASSVDTEGSLPASSKDENRTISFSVECLSAAALRTLQAKVAKISRERGTLKYTLPNGEVIVFDLLARQSFTAEFDVKYFIHTGAYCSVDFSFAALPYGRGPSVSATLSASTATSKQPLVFTVTGVKGDIPALGSLTLSNVTNAKTWAVWGIQSRYYDSASLAGLFFEAEDGQVGGGALNAGSAGASGGGANKVVRYTDVGTVGNSSAYFLGASGSAAITHIGAYRVFMRAQALSTNTGTVSVRVQWKPTALSAGITNDWVPIETSGGVAIKGSWVLVDLGLVIVPKARAGTQRWLAEFELKSTVGTDDIDLDWAMLVPVDEGSGRLKDTGGGIAVGGVVEVAHNAAQVRSSGTPIWYDPTSYEGDYLRIPPAGAEGRTTRIVALLAGPVSNTGNVTDTIIDAVNLDAFTATLSYQPRYLVVPEP